MTKKLISALISTMFSFALLSGIDTLHQFAFYVTAVMNGCAWLALFCGSVKDDVAAGLRSYLWISLPSSAFSLYAMIFTGHTVLAASSFMVTFFILILAFKKPEVAA
ncbi:hypothetical protein [Pseudomonas sp. GL-RE-29]|uniref:hypothetical protein n=1 Tax=Pseudomonas sp. GL-RE-29 TaxID=2832375 RepID=UPI001CC0F5BB|nr:hypothetical protein [Pseudomonas sp. GL-RE-29]